MPEPSTTPGNNPDDTAAGSTTEQASTQTGTDNQPGGDANNLDASKSTDDKPADDDKSTDVTKSDDAPANQFDDDLDDWIEKRGLPKPADEAQKQKFQDLRNEQREFTRSQQEKKNSDELAQAVKEAKPEKSDTDDDDDLDENEKRLKALEEDRDAERTTRLQSEFYTSNKVSPTEHKAILEIFKEKVARPSTTEGKLAAVKLWGSPEALPDLLDIARARIAKSTDNSVVADEAARKERERIARESEAKSPGRNASAVTTSDKSDDDARYERFKARYNK